MYIYICICIYIGKLMEVLEQSAYDGTGFWAGILRMHQSRQRIHTYTDTHKHTPTPTHTHTLTQAHPVHTSK